MSENINEALTAWAESIKSQYAIKNMWDVMPNRHTDNDPYFGERCDIVARVYESNNRISVAEVVNDVLGFGKFLDPRDVDVVRVGEAFEKALCASRPKGADMDRVELYRTLHTDLYQWYASKKGSPWLDPVGPTLRIKS